MCACAKCHVCFPHLSFCFFEFLFTLVCLVCHEGCLNNSSLSHAHHKPNRFLDNKLVTTGQCALRVHYCPTHNTNSALIFYCFSFWFRSREYQQVPRSRQNVLRAAQSRQSPSQHRHRMITHHAHTRIMFTLCPYPVRPTAPHPHNDDDREQTDCCVCDCVVFV